MSMSIRSRRRRRSATIVGSLWVRARLFWADNPELRWAAYAIITIAVVALATAWIYPVPSTVLAQPPLLRP